MKKKYILNVGKGLTKFFLGLLLLLSAALYSQPNHKVPFKPRASEAAPGNHKNKKIYHLQGDFTMLGNTNLLISPYVENDNNSSNNMKFVKVDGGSNIRNASSSRFVLPANADISCTKIIFAGLYWAGRGNNDSGDILQKFDRFGRPIANAGNGLNKRNVKFKAPGMSNYMDLRSDEIFYGAADVAGMYTGYYDVTELVRKAGTGDYFVGNIATLEGGSGDGTGYYAGWGMVIVYENTALKWRDITVFDGFSQIKYQRGNEFGQLDISGFNSVQKGDVKVKMGMMAGEGDFAIAGDYFQIRKRNTNNWQTLSHGGNTANNFFNSSIYTGGNPRNPDVTNNYGIDISMFDIDNSNNQIINNGQSSTAFRFGTTQDLYSIFNITFAVDAYVPDVEGLNRITNGIESGSSVLPGQVLELELDVFNRGTELIKNGKIEIPIPSNLHYVSSSIELGSGTVQWVHPFSTDPTSTPGGKLVWTMGDIPLAAKPKDLIAKLKYKLRVTDDCTLLTTSNASCGLSIDLNGKITGTGSLSSTELDAEFIRGYEPVPCEANPIRESIRFDIKVDADFTKSCPIIVESGSRQFKAFCFAEGNFIPRAEVTSNYPAGTVFYTKTPGSSGFSASMLSGDFALKTDGTVTHYYAVVEGMAAGCYLKLDTVLEVIKTSPKAKDVQFCMGEEVIFDVVLSDIGQANNYKLYFFNSEDSESPVVNLPDFTAVGNYTLYAAEGVEKEGRICFGPKVAFRIQRLAGPVFVENLKDFYVCLESDLTIQIKSADSQDTIEWEFYNTTTLSWQVVKASDFDGHITVNQQHFAIVDAPEKLDGLKIRAKLSNANGCDTYSQEVEVEVIICKIPTNPMIRVKTKNTI